MDLDLSAEFYKHYFPRFGHLFTGILNRDTTGLLSETQRVGLITLLCKKPEEAHKIDNWRPITLLNCDYKIIAKTINNRFKKVAHLLINPYQTCGARGRKIYDNLHLIRNAYDYCQEKKFPCLMVPWPLINRKHSTESATHSFLSS
jgi:hypothetical protein